MRNPNPNSTSSKEESHSYASSSSLPRRTEAVDNDERQETGSTLSFPSSTANTLNPSIEDNQQTVVPCLLHLSFNQDHGCFAVGMDQGFRIYTCEPFEENARRIFDQGGGIGIVEMLFKCNIFALVGDGSDPQYPPNKLMIWDDHLNRFTADKSFQSKIRAVRLRRDRIIVVIEQKIFVHNFEDWKLLHEIETFVNPKGLCAVSQVSGSFVLVCPGLRKGEVRVEHYGSKRRTILVLAHESRIACFALSQDGKLLATASTKGTLVRIYNTFDGALLQEVRRGADRADIYSLAFSPTAQWLAVSSDKGTVHIFSLKVNSGLPKTNKSHGASDPNLPTLLSTSSLSFIKGMLPKYFSSEWSVCQFRLHEGPQYIVAFGQKNTIVVVGMDGSFYRCQFDPKKGGEMTQLEFYNFLSPKETF